MDVRNITKLLLVALACWIFWRFLNPAPIGPETSVHKSRFKNSEIQESPQNIQPPIPEPVKATNHEPTEVPAKTPPPPPTPRSQDIKEVTYRTRDEFIEYFRTRKFEAWMDQAKPYAATSSEAGLNNGVSFETGVIVTAKGDFEYRYWVAFNEQEELKPHSCISIRPPQGDLIIGSAADNSLTVYKLPIENARIYKIKDRHFFVTYEDATESRQGPYGDPTSPLLLQAWLYYTRDPDGHYVYQGKRERWSEHTDRKMEMNAQEFCRYSYASRPGE